jgi:tetratricopeptide (TPR) repeat protein
MNYHCLSARQQLRLSRFLRIKIKLNGLIVCLALCANFQAAQTKEVSAANPNYRDPELEKIEAVYYNGVIYSRCDQGLKIVENYLKHHKTNAFAHYLKGLGSHCKGYSKFTSYKNAKEIEGEMLKAISSYNTAMNLGLRSATIYYNRGEAKVVLHMARQAQLEAAKTTKRDPLKDWVWAARGMLYASLGDNSPASRNDIIIKEALIDLNESIKLNPKTAGVWGARAMALGAQGHYKLARLSAEKAISLNPNFGTFYYELAVICMEMKDYQAVKKAMNKAIILEPNNPINHLLRAQAALAQNDAHTAEADIDFVLRIQPDNAAALTLQSAIGIKQNQPEQALADMMAADELQLKLAAPAHARQKITATVARQLLSRAASQYKSLTNYQSEQALYELATLEFGLQNWQKSATGFETLLKRSKNIGATEMHSVALCTLAYCSLNRPDKHTTLLHDYIGLTTHKGFPGNIVQYLAGQISETELDAKVRSLQDRTLANFYIGCRLARFKERAKAKERLTWVQNHGDQSMDQYLLAITELDKINKPK